MRTVTREEVQESMDRVQNMTENEARKFMARMQEEQPYIVLYVAAISDRGDFEDENDTDAFVNLAGIIWHSMRRAAGGPLVEVQGHDLDEREAKIMQLYDYAEDEPEDVWPNMVEAWMDGYNQQPILESVLETVVSPENPYGVTEEGSGIIFTFLKVIIDCLDNAELEREL